MSDGAYRPSPPGSRFAPRPPRRNHATSNRACLAVSSTRSLESRSRDSGWRPETNARFAPGRVSPRPVGNIPSPLSSTPPSSVSPRESRSFVGAGVGVPGAGSTTSRPRRAASRPEEADAICRTRRTSPTAKTRVRESTEKRAPRRRPRVGSNRPSERKVSRASTESKESSSACRSPRRPRERPRPRGSSSSRFFFSFVSPFRLQSPTPPPRPSRRWAPASTTAPTLSPRGRRDDVTRGRSS